MKVGKLLTTPAARVLGLMSLRSMTIAAKFALTLFITRYLGLAELGIYGIIISATAVAPVAFGFGVSNNLAREAAKRGPADIAPAILQYFVVLAPIYGALCALGLAMWPDRTTLVLLLLALLLLEHVLSDMYSIMCVIGEGVSANIIYFVRFAGWSLPYIALALFEPKLQNLTTIIALWVAGSAVAALMTVLFTRHWRWGDAVERLPRVRISAPHRHGSMALYVADVANVLFMYLDRYIVGLLLSPTLLGVYVLYWTITNALSNLITIAVVQVERGALVKVAHRATQSFNRTLGKVCITTGGLALALGMASTLMMYLVVPHLGRPAAEPYLPLMLVLVLGLILRTIYEVIGISFYAYGRDDIVLYSGVAILILALGLNVALTPVIGVWGAGWTVVASYVAGTIGRGLVIMRGFRCAPGHGRGPTPQTAP